MNTQKIADKFIKLWREDRVEEAIQELYGKDMNKPQFLLTRKRKGIKKIFNKSMHNLMHVEEFHDTVISDPLIIGDYFCFRLIMDMTIADFGHSAVKESWVFQVEGDKIVYERYFNNPGTNLNLINI